MNTRVLTIIASLGIFLISLTTDTNEIKFTYPKKKNISLVMYSDLFKTFKEEWRGEDYYYLGDGKDGQKRLLLPGKGWR